MGYLNFAMILIFSSFAFAEVMIDPSVYHTTKPQTKITDLGVTVASNETDFHLVLKKKQQQKKNPLVHRGLASEKKRVSKVNKKSKRKLASVTTNNR